jgi:hypothetical protein
VIVVAGLAIALATPLAVVTTPSDTQLVTADLPQVWAGRVVDERGRPVAGVLVQPIANYSSGGTSASSGGPVALDASARSDAKGRFRVNDVDRSLVVQAHLARDWGFRDVAVPPSGILVMPAALSYGVPRRETERMLHVRGRVMVNGAPADVAISTLESLALDWYEPTECSTTPWRTVVRTNRAGEFDLPVFHWGHVELRLGCRAPVMVDVPPGHDLDGVEIEIACPWKRWVDEAPGDRKVSTTPSRSLPDRWWTLYP